jgi:hypothetical protein
MDIYFSDLSQIIWHIYFLGVEEKQSTIQKPPFVYEAAGTPTHRSLMVLVKVESLPQLRWKLIRSEIFLLEPPSKMDRFMIEKLAIEIYPL